MTTPVVSVSILFLTIISPTKINPIFTANSLSNEFAVHLMLFNSIEIMSRRYVNDAIYYKLTCFDMNSMEGSSASASSNPTVSVTNSSSAPPAAMDEESLGIGDEYSAEIGVMNNLEHKFHAQQQYGRLLKANEFVMFRARMPMTEHIVSHC